jgi:hypothetical protein
VAEYLLFTTLTEGARYNWFLIAMEASFTAGFGYHAWQAFCVRRLQRPVPHPVMIEKR